MGLTELAQATFWGAVIIFALITFYFWFLAEDKSFFIGLGSFGFMCFIAWLGVKLR